MLSPEHVLPLGQLLCTLGTVLEAAANTIAHGAMAATLTEFLLVARLYSNEYIEVSNHRYTVLTCSLVAEVHHVRTLACVTHYTTPAAP